MKTISTDEAPKAPGLLSQATISNNFIFVAGQGHITTDGTLVEGSTAAKVDQIMRNLAAILKAAGADFSNVVKATVYVTDIAELPELNKTYASYFTEPFPAREAVCVKALPLGMSVEISVVAERE